jgi:hypothetical protein
MHGAPYDRELVRNIRLELDRVTHDEMHLLVVFEKRDDRVLRVRDGAIGVSTVLYSIASKLP